MRVLMLVCTVADDPVHDAGGRRRVDFREISSRLGADVLDLGAVSRSRAGRVLLRRLGGYVALAVLALVRLRRHPADVVLCDNENEALVLSALLRLTRRRVPLVTLSINAAAPKKRAFFRLGLADRVDLWLSHNTAGLDLLTGRLGVPPERVRLLPFYADEAFYDRSAVTGPFAGRPSARPYVLAVGRQHRDFPLLVQVAGQLDADVVVAAGSLYSRSPDRLTGQALPASVTVVTLDYDTLRQAYADAAVVVVPTVEADFGPGITAVLEAMSMGRPVVWTRARGNGDYVADRRSVLRTPGPARATRGTVASVFDVADPDACGPHGMQVPVGDAEALRGAVGYLLEHPQEAEEMGRRGRLLVEQVLSFDAFVDRVCDAVREVATRRTSRG